MKKFKIESSGAGTGRIQVEGEDISDVVTAYQVTGGAREVTEVVLQCSVVPHVLEGEGMVTIAHPGRLAEAINSLDPGLIEAAALSRSSWGQSKSHTELIIDVIVEKLNELESRSNS